MSIGFSEFEEEDELEQMSVPAQQGPVDELDSFSKPVGADVDEISQMEVELDQIARQHGKEGAGEFPFRITEPYINLNKVKVDPLSEEDFSKRFHAISDAQDRYNKIRTAAYYADQDIKGNLGVAGRGKIEDHEGYQNEYALMLQDRQRLEEFEREYQKKNKLGGLVGPTVGRGMLQKSLDSVESGVDSTMNSIAETIGDVPEILLRELNTNPKTGEVNESAFEGYGELLEPGRESLQREREAAGLRDTINPVVPENSDPIAEGFYGALNMAPAMLGSVAMPQSKLAQIGYWGAVEYPQVKRELVELGADEKSAEAYAIPASIAIGVIEQFGDNRKFLFGSPQGKAIKRRFYSSLPEVLGDWAKRTGIQLGKEWSEEAMQEGVGVATKYFASLVEEEMQAPEFDEVMSEGYSNLRKAALSLPFLMGGSSLVQGGRDVASQRQSQAVLDRLLKENPDISKAEMVELLNRQMGDDVSPSVEQEVPQEDPVQTISQEEQSPLPETSFDFDEAVEGQLSEKSPAEVEALWREQFPNKKGLAPAKSQMIEELVGRQEAPIQESPQDQFVEENDIPSERDLDDSMIPDPDVVRNESLTPEEMQEDLIDEHVRKEASVPTKKESEVVGGYDNYTELAEHLARKAQVQGHKKDLVDYIRKSGIDADAGDQRMIRKLTETYEKEGSPKQREPKQQPETKFPPGKVGEMLGEHDIRKTKSGRLTTEHPRVDTSTDRKATNSLNRQRKWLLDNAIKEAEANNDEFNLQQFQGEDPKNMPPAVVDSLNEYLFGEAVEEETPMKNEFSEKILTALRNSLNVTRSVPLAKRGIWKTIGDAWNAANSGNKADPDRFVDLIKEINPQTPGDWRLIAMKADPDTAGMIQEEQKPEEPEPEIDEPALKAQEVFNASMPELKASIKSTEEEGVFRAELPDGQWFTVGFGKRPKLTKKMVSAALELHQLKNTPENIDRIQNARGWYASSDKEGFKSKYGPLGLVTIGAKLEGSKDPKSFSSTLKHEMFHLAFRTGAFTQAEKDSLMKEFGSEEGIASAVEKDESLLDKIVRHIKQLLSTVRAADPVVDQLVKDIASGKLVSDRHEAKKGIGKKELADKKSDEQIAAEADVSQELVDDRKRRDQDDKRQSLIDSAVKVDVPAASIESILKGDVSQVQKDVDAGRIDEADVQSFAELAVADGLIPESKLKQFAGVRKAKSKKGIGKKEPKQVPKKEKPPETTAEEAMDIDFVSIVNDEIDLSKVPLDVLIHAHKTVEGMGRGYHSDEWNMKNALDEEFSHRGVPPYREGSEASRWLFEKWQATKSALGEKQDALAEAKAAVETAIQTEFHKYARANRIPSGRGYLGYSAAKKWKDAVASAQQKAREEQSVADARERVSKAEKVVEEWKAVEKEQKAEYVKESAEGFPKVPIGQKRIQISGNRNQHSFVEVKSFDKKTGLYTVANNGGYELTVSSQPLLDNFATEKELAVANKLKKDISSLRKVIDDKNAKIEKAKKDKEEAASAKAARESRKERSKEKRYFRDAIARSKELPVKKKFKAKFKWGKHQVEASGERLGNFLIHKEFAEADDGGPPIQKGKHQATWIGKGDGHGNALPVLSSLADVKSFFVIAQDAGVDLVGIDKWESISSEDLLKLKTAQKIWENEAFYEDEKNHKGAYEAIKSNIPEAPDPGVEADVIVDSTDLMPGDKKLSPIIKNLAKEVPEFAFNPVLNVTENKGLSFESGSARFEFSPQVFGLTPGELEVGSTVGVNLEDVGIKKIGEYDVEEKEKKNLMRGNLDRSESQSDPSKTTHSAAGYASSEPETTTGRKLIQSLINDEDGSKVKKVGLRRINEFAIDLAQALLMIGNTQTTRKNPAHYHGRNDPTPHIIRSRVAHWQLNFHEAAHAMSKLISMSNPGFREQIGKKVLMDLANPEVYPDTMASGHSMEEGWAELVRRYIVHPSSLEEQAIERFESVLGRIDGELLSGIRDTHRAYSYQRARPVLSQMQSLTMERPKKPKFLEQASDVFARGMFNTIGADTVLHRVFRRAWLGIGGDNVLSQYDPFGVVGLSRSVVDQNYKNMQAVARKFFGSIKNTESDVESALNARLHARSEASRALLGSKVNEGVRVAQTGEGFAAFSEEELEALSEHFKIPESASHGDWLYLGKVSPAAVKERLGEDWEAFSTWGQYKVALQRYRKKGHPIPGMQDGLTPEIVEENVKSMSNPKWEREFKNINKYFDDLLLVSVLSGEFSVGEAVAMKTTWPEYWALPRQIEGRPVRRSGAGVEPSSGIKRTFGSDNAFVSLDEAIQERTRKVFEAYYSNRTMQVMSNFGKKLAMLEGAPFKTRADAARMMIPLMKENKKVATMRPDEEMEVVLNALSQMFPDEEYSAEDVDIAWAGKDIWRSKKPNAINVVRVFNNGGYQYYQVPDLLLFDLFASTTVKPNKYFAWVARMFNGLKEPWRRAITQNLVFGARNMLARDPATAGFMGEDFKSMIPFYYAAVGVINRVRGKSMDAVSASELLSRSLEATVRKPHQKIVESFAEMMKEGIVPSEQWSLADIPGQALSTLMKPIDVFNYFTGGRAMSTFGEEVGREGAYMTERDKGASHERAQLAYDEVTGKFGQRGANPNVAALLKMAGFLNPAIQIMWGQAKRVYHPDPKMRAFYTSAKLPYLALVGAVGAAVNRLLIAVMYDDEEEEQILSQMRERTDKERLSSMALMGKVRIPFDYGIIGSMSSFGWNSTEEMLLDDKIDGKKKAEELIRRARDLPGFEDIIPPHIKTMMELSIGGEGGQEGYSWFLDEEIVPSYLIDQYPNNPELRAFDNTPETYKKIGESIGVSPLKVRYFIRNIFTSQMDEFVRAYDRPDKSIRDIPQVGKLYLNPSTGFGSESVRSLMDLEDEYDRLKAREVAIPEALKESHDNVLLVEEVWRLAKEKRADKAEFERYRRIMTGVARLALDKPLEREFPDPVRAYDNMPDDVKQLMDSRIDGRLNLLVPFKSSEGWKSGRDEPNPPKEPKEPSKNRSDDPKAWRAYDKAMAEFPEKEEKFPGRMKDFKEKQKLAVEFIKKHSHLFKKGVGRREVDLINMKRDLKKIINGDNAPKEPVYKSTMDWNKFQESRAKFYRDLVEFETAQGDATIMLAELESIE